MGVKQVREEDGMISSTHREGDHSPQRKRTCVNQIGRSTQGVKLMDLEAEDKIVSIAKIVEKDNGEVAESISHPTGRW